jgi:MoaA/NifB/PqqE/SkfB family radical SAM enzyme
LSATAAKIFPCGYLPVEAGNIRQQPFREIWEGSAVFADLRDPDLLAASAACANSNASAAAAGRGPTG